MIIEITNLTPRDEANALIDNMCATSAFYMDVEFLFSEWERAGMPRKHFNSALFSELALTYEVPDEVTGEPLVKVGAGSKRRGGR